ncbi:hypothetical protein D3C80_2176310 [compost metagenome]
MLTDGLADMAPVIADVKEHKAIVAHANELVIFVNELLDAEVFPHEFDELFKDHQVLRVEPNGLK